MPFPSGTTTVRPKLNSQRPTHGRGARVSEPQPVSKGSKLFTAPYRSPSDLVAEAQIPEIILKKIEGTAQLRAPLPLEPSLQHRRRPAADRSKPQGNRKHQGTRGPRRSLHQLCEFMRVGEAFRLVQDRMHEAGGAADHRKSATEQLKKPKAGIKRSG